MFDFVKLGPAGTAQKVTFLNLPSTPKELRNQSSTFLLQPISNQIKSNLIVSVACIARFTKF